MRERLRSSRGVPCVMMCSLLMYARTAVTQVRGCVVETLKSAAIIRGSDGDLKIGEKMSRLGKKPVGLPSGVKVSVSGKELLVEGPKGKLTWTLPKPISVAVDEAGWAVVSRDGDSREAKSLHGLSRALLQNMVVGVTQGYEKKLEIVGVGYLAAISGKVLQLRVGLANELQVPVPDGLTVTCPDQQHVLVQGIDKQLVTSFAASVRAMRKPEPYKGKGIRYDGEAVRRKQGKVMAK